jgi:molybdate transport system regulatory protein
MSSKTSETSSAVPRKATGKPSARRQRPVARFRMRVMSGETIAIGPGKIALLEAIDETRSITAAARSINMSYRRAWMLIDQLNAALKKPAVRSAKGGEHGGGSELTPAGAALIAVYRRIETRAAQTCAGEIDSLLSLVR